MKKIMILLLTLCVLLGAAGSSADTMETAVQANGYRPDQTVYQGDWENIYLRVLEEYSYQIHTYQNIAVETDGEQGRDLPCFPVGLRDLNDDGIPELYFLAANGERGDMYIYSGNGSTGQCVLYVPGITRLDYDDKLGFRIWLVGGNKLKILHYRYEEEYLLEFYVDKTAPYVLFSWMSCNYDHSGEGEDYCFRNGNAIPTDAYYAELDTWNTGGICISDYFSDNWMSYGLDYTYETAVSILGGANSGPAQQPKQSGNGDIYGLTIDKLATRKGPGTQYEGGGTYNVKGQQIKVLAKAWDKRNGIWWIKCEIPYKKQIRVLWTGYKRFDHNSFNLDDLPEEVW